MSKKGKCRDCEDCRSKGVKKIAKFGAKATVAYFTAGTSLIAEQAHKKLMTEMCPICGHYMMHHEAYRKRVEKELAAEAKEAEQIERETQKENSVRFKRLRRRFSKLNPAKVAEQAKRPISDLAKDSVLLDKVKTSRNLQQLSFLRVLLDVRQKLVDEIKSEENQANEYVEGTRSNVEEELTSIDEDFARLDTMRKQDDLRANDLDSLEIRLAVLEETLADLPGKIKQQIVEYRKNLQPRLKQYTDLWTQVSTWIDEGPAFSVDTELLLLDRAEVAENEARQKGLLYLTNDQLVFFSSPDSASPDISVPLADVTSVEIEEKRLFGRSDALKLCYSYESETQHIKIRLVGKTTNELWLGTIASIMNERYKEIGPRIEQFYQRMYLG